jgi:hypothetical protein
MGHKIYYRVWSVGVSETGFKRVQDQDVPGLRLGTFPFGT